MPKGKQAVTCLKCGEDYSAGWPRCPGCAEPNPRSDPGVRLGAPGLLVVVLLTAFLLALLGGMAAWVAFGPH
jgi:hypothetical protein